MLKPECYTDTTAEVPLEYRSTQHELSSKPGLINARSRQIGTLLAGYCSTDKKYRQAERQAYKGPDKHANG